MSVYKELKSQITIKELELKHLKLLLKETCPHNDVIQNAVCDDDWAMPKTYTISYKCEFCSLYGSASSDYSDNEETYKKLKAKYDKQKEKMWRRNHHGIQT